MKRLLKKIYPLLFLLPFFLSSTASAGMVDTSLSVNKILMEDFIKSSLPVNAKWAFSAVDIDTGERLIDAGNARDIPLVPGSLAKLFVTAALLELNMKEKIELPTIIAFKGERSQKIFQGNLYIKGNGNAFLSENDIKSVVKEIRSIGIKEISGDIVVDDTLFETDNWVKSRYYGSAYSTPSALGLDLHTISITVSENLPHIEIKPRNEAVKMTFNRNAKSIHQVDDLTYEIPAHTSDVTIMKKRFPLQNPSLYAGGTLMTLLKENGVNVRGTVRKGKLPSRVTEIYRIESKDLSEIIKDTNTNSLNMVADNLLLLLGAKRFGEPGTAKKGVNAVKEFLKGIGLDSERLQLADGAGLSEENRMTAEQITTFLKIISEKPYLDTFYESLPQAGIEGTLKNIGYKNKALRAKTGHLIDAYCLAGYANRNDGRRIAFTYMVNVPGADLLERYATGRLLERLVDGEL